ncbi:sensor histidine kinase [Heliorestis convoluta]|uniref:histidine kinase n=1 Tax=Heliorestis convoluta TaxID=356322 RepID=A0A5Q2MWZ3_9FIRM|nr:ATP-binding protein [Heliorestis convoluta]QGG46261.1 HAMP domain protein [Heliorestis convoluta]
MKLRTKILLSTFLIIFSLAVVYIFLSIQATNAVFDRYEKHVQHHIDDHMIQVLAQYYVFNNESWQGVERQFMPVQIRDRDRMSTNNRRPAMVLFDEKEEPIAAWPRGSHTRWSELDFNTFGIKKTIEVNQKVVGTLWLPSPNIINFEGIKTHIFSTMLVSFLLSILISSIIAFGISYLLASRLTRPLHQLAKATEKIKKRRFDVRLPITSKDELGTVMSAFNEMNKELQRGEQVRKNMVADVAHELRTPLTVMQGQLESIQQGLIAPTVENILPIHDEVIRMNRLIDDLRQLSLAESGNLPLRRIDTDMQGLVRRILEIFSIELEARKLHGELNVYGEIPILSVDPDRITQVIVNILSNAMEYSPLDGKIRIIMREISLSMDEGDKELDELIYSWTYNSAEDQGIDHVVPEKPLLRWPEKQAKKQKGLLLTIVDEGPGIALEHLPHVFDRFYRCDSSRGRKKGGTGLGLAIAKEFVLAHGGMITVQSGKKKGSCFAVFLPAQKEEKSGQS